jgi:peptidyl-prolyl cis-trans isomerase A (cyclophilin A)
MRISATVFPKPTFKPMRLLLLLLFPVTVHAQIYADFNVRQGSTPLGTFRVLLEHTKAPRTCANFIGLASGKRPWIDLKNGAVRTNKPFYDGITFHRLIHNFVIQTGSPNGIGNDGPGYSVLDEYHPDLNHSQQYVVSMAKTANPSTGGSQFFITLAPTPNLDNKHSVFGKVISGTSVIDGFKNPTAFPTGANDVPLTPIVIESVVISGPSYEAFDINNPGLRLPHASGTEVAIRRDEAASSMTAIFDRKPQTDYLIFRSSDLSAWQPAGLTVLSIDAQNAYEFTIESLPEPRYFMNIATMDYGQIPNAPSDLNSPQKTLRILFANGGGHLNITPNGSGGGTWTDTANRSGTITQTEWTDSAPSAGVFTVNTPQSYFISLGDFRTTLQNYPTAGNSVRLETWLSFHTPTSGWTEEIGTGPANRYAFQIISN